jgi:MoaA/NifB/PqqE/SkfB family radical SAM enzyme
MHISDMIQRIGLMKAYEYLDEDPDRNMPKLVAWLEREDAEGSITRQLEKVKTFMEDPQSSWYKLARSFWDDVDDEVRKTIFTNFVVNGTLLANPRLTENRRKYDCNIPWAIVIELTSECNLHCADCPQGGTERNLSFDELDSIIEQGKALGTYFYIFSGGEPLTRREELIALCNKHSDCEFLAFTNGTLIDETFAAEMLRVKNFLQAISLDGLEREVDGACGAGAFARKRRAMELLRSRKLPFGVTSCCDRDNLETICSETFFDTLVDFGAKLAWVYPYLPNGRQGDPEKMVTASQRETLYHTLRQLRSTKPLLIFDFWNEGEFFGGCIAGGRDYCHISAAGDVEPCSCIHYSDSNIRSKTLLEAYRSPLFMAYHRGHPFNRNMLRPCPLLDNPGCLSGMVDGAGAHSTDPQGSEDVHVLSDKCASAAREWTPVAERLWREAGHTEQ